jgi:hypothetical protein
MDNLPAIPFYVPKKSFPLSVLKIKEERSSKPRLERCSMLNNHAQN